MKFILLMVSLSLISSCARSSISERDSRREQIRVNAELKRKELQKVAGNYKGTLHNATGADRSTVVHLEVKDYPEKVEGQVDPVMVPALTGYLRFLLSEDPGSSEFIPYGLERAEFDSTTSKLDLVFRNANYGQLIIAFFHDGKTLTGNWAAPENATSGAISLTLNDGSAVVPGPGGEEPVTLTGDYNGFLYREKNDLYHRSQLTLRTHLDPELGLQVSGSLKIFFDSSEETQYLTFQFAKISFNPTQGQLVLKSPDGNLLMSCDVEGSHIEGVWYSDTIGRMGVLEFSKSTVPKVKPEAQAFVAVTGPYKGRLINTHPETSLDGPFQVNFSVAQDLSKPSGIAITGEMLIYLDITGTYDKIPFSSVTYDFFTGKTIAQTTEKYRTTLDLQARGASLEGDFYWASHGKVARVEVSK